MCDCYNCEKEKKYEEYLFAAFNKIHLMEHNGATEEEIKEFAKTLINNKALHLKAIMHEDKKYKDYKKSTMYYKMAINSHEKFCLHSFYRFIGAWIREKIESMKVYSKAF
tara:strand:- start:773 stop:1102 length:330 start_codon:yes stop_codon:yes gene_type:complete